MNHRTLSILEFISESSSQFCDQYYRQGCATCPMNLNGGECLLTNLPEVIKDAVNDYLNQRQIIERDIEEVEEVKEEWF